jgi:hypothetical protein
MFKGNSIIKSFGFAGKRRSGYTPAHLAGKNSAGQNGRMCYYVHAFVALVTPLDSILEGLRVQTRGLFCFTAGGSRAAANNLNKE